MFVSVFFEHFKCEVQRLEVKVTFFPFPTACDKSLKAVNRHSEFHILDLAPVPNNQSRLVRNLSYIKPFSGGSRRNNKAVMTLPTATLMTTS